MRLALCYALTGFLLAHPVAALPDLTGADVVVIGELHDNPDHHAAQAQIIRKITNPVVVFEMLTPAEADQLADVLREVPEMRRATTGFHWSNIADYAEILASSAVIHGAAIPGEEVRAAFNDGAAAVFGPQAARYGLDQPLPEDQQSRREALQFAAHCEAMPLEMMGGMVEAQRLRDASFARSVLEALALHGSPVVLITGNGHARTDWGVPSYLAKVAPDLKVVSIGQLEGDGTEAPFDSVQLADPPPGRGDPCAAFR